MRTLSRANNKHTLKFNFVCHKTFPSRRVRTFVAWARFEVEGFEFLGARLFLKSKGSMFGRAYSIHNRRVRALVACCLFQIEGFEVWARVHDSRSKGSRFGRFGFLLSKGSRFGR